MINTNILFPVLFALLIIIDMPAQEMPLVYEVENTGADCPVPYMPTINELPKVENLPDPFEWSDGRGRIKYFSDWRYRRAEIKAEIEHYEIGTKPDRPEDITASYANDTLTVNITVNGNTLTLTSPIILPEGEGPFPAVIGMGWGTGSLPSDIFSSSGIAQIAFNFGQVMAHTQTRGNEPINSLYPELVYMGAYSAWPWGVSRLIDGLELVSDDLNIDLKRLAVTGCSFAGKMALFAGALDERIALTISQESGGGGYTTWRFSETLGNVETLSRTSREWFIQDMFQFGSAVSKLPHDHHELMAMVAPRALLVLGNPDFVWLADESGHVGSKAAKEVYNALGIPDRFGYSIVGGHGHCALPNSQRPEVEAFVDKFLLGDTNANTNVAVTPYSTDLTPWITWDTPYLTIGTSYFGKTGLIYPDHQQEDMDTSITFIWNEAENAEEYIFQLSTDPSFESIDIVNSTSDTIYTVDDLHKGKRYYWRVQVQNNSGAGPFSNMRNFITAISIPDIPLLIAASVVSGRSDYVTVKWQSVKYADKYTVHMSEYQSFSSVKIFGSTEDTVINLSGTEEGLKYYWRVQARNIAGAGPWSSALEFTLIQPPTDLELEKTGLNEITLKWDDNSGVEEGYLIERKESDESEFTVIDSVDENGEEYINAGIEQTDTYTYRIKAYIADAASEYSNEASLNFVGVKEEQAAGEIPDEYSLSQNYPNPFNPSTIIKFALPEPAFTKIIVYDLLGGEIKLLVNEQLGAGVYEINFDTEFAGLLIPSGVYFYSIQSENFFQTRKMILMK